MARINMVNRVWTGLGVAALALLVFAPAMAEVPNQFIAKHYTEALGRAPDPTGWTSLVNYFQANGCTQATLKSAGRSLYLSTEYSNLGYTNEEKVLTLYRGIFSRDPDAAGYQSWLDFLNEGGSFQTAVDSFYDSSEFASLVSTICVGGPYSFGGTAITIPTAGTGFSGGTGSQLQALLDAAAPGSTVYLAQRSVTYLDNPLIIPANVTLATWGTPDRNHYARMGRLVRNSAMSGYLLPAAVKLKSGAALLSVWVSGQRHIPGIGFNTLRVNVSIREGGNVTVQNSRLDNTAGWTQLEALGNPVACPNVVISGNLVVGYNGTHAAPSPDGPSDGLSISCGSTSVTNNNIVDPTDVGIVIFNANEAVQTSQVIGNRIVSAGLSAFGATGFDPGSGSSLPDFTGASINNNQFWTGTTTHFDIGLYVGARAWYPDDQAIDGTGASAQNNTTGGISTRMDVGIAVDGMLNATVQGNNFQTSAVDVSACPNGVGDPTTVGVGIDFAGGHASGNLQQGQQATLHNCIGH